MMDWNWAGLRRPESRRNSSSVRMVLRDRFAAAGSMPILFVVLVVVFVEEVHALWKGMMLGCYLMAR